MNIQEATKSAMERGRGMRRESSPFIYTTMIPTNSPECVLTITRAEGDNERLSPRWNPTADDLLADDWAVCEREVWPYGRPKKGRVEISSVYEGNRDIPYAARERGTDIISERGEPRSTKRKYLFRFPGAIGSD